METLELQHTDFLSSAEQRIVLVPPVTHEFIVALQIDHANLAPHVMDNFWVDVQFEPHTSHEHYGLVIAAFLHDLPPEAMDGDLYTVRHRTTRMFEKRNVMYDRVSVRPPAQIGLDQCAGAPLLADSSRIENSGSNESVVFTTSSE